MKTRNPTSIHLLGTVVLLASTMAASRLAADRKPEPLAHPLDTIGRSLAGFSATDNPPINEKTLAVLRPTSYLSRTYTKPELAADLFIGFYSQQRAGENMHSPKHCLPGAGWEIWDYSRTDVVTPRGPVSINRY